MIVSWDWLQEYVSLSMPQAELENRLAMAGLNHEESWTVGTDVAIDLEVTSNRPDCLGHIGVAREISVLWDQPLRIPRPKLSTSANRVADACQVTIQSPDLCPRYTARVIRGVKVGPSPDWLAKRLQTVGIAVINNVVDITNYVMLECGQPLHAFDFAKINGQQIIVREATKDEPFVAIDHKTYTLQPGMCVIADTSGPVALGGVMGGETSEVSPATTDLLIEAADFAPLAVRGAARGLRLHSPSSYRFERRVDPEGIDWASRRACQLIQEIAGGELLDGVMDVHPGPKAERAPILFRFSEIRRILGIDLDASRALQILEKLGVQFDVESTTDTQAAVIGPSWRRDLTREIDLIEEVARIHGYEQIPEDVGVPMVPSYRSDQDRLMARVRTTLAALGFSEAMTPSLATPEISDAFSPWTSAEPIRSNTPALRGADCLRRSLVPSLLAARRTNQSLANARIELFEMAKVYLPASQGLPEEPMMVALTSGDEFKAVKGVIEAVLAELAVDRPLHCRAAVDHQLLAGDASCELRLGDDLLGYLGELSPAGLKNFGLRTRATVAEFRLSTLLEASDLVPQYQPLSAYPAITQDLNFVVDESVRWSDLSSTVQAAAGELLEDVRYCDTYRDTSKDGAGKKRLILSLVLRSQQETLTGEQAEEVRNTIVAACKTKHGAVLLG